MNIAAGAREASGSWLAAFGTLSLDVALVASRDLTADHSRQINGWLRFTSPEPSLAPAAPGLDRPTAFCRPPS